jgi:hypothetical protein
MAPSVVLLAVTVASVALTAVAGGDSPAARLALVAIATTFGIAAVAGVLRNRAPAGSPAMLAPPHAEPRRSLVPRPTPTGRTTVAPSRLRHASG